MKNIAVIFAFSYLTGCLNLATNESTSISYLNSNSNDTTLNYRKKIFVESPPIPEPPIVETVVETLDFEDRDYSKSINGLKGNVSPDYPYGQYGELAMDSDGYQSASSLKLRVPDDFPYDQLGNTGLRLLPLVNKSSGVTADWFLSPEIDLVRMRVKVLSGEFRFFIAAEMVFFSGLGNVQCGDQIVKKIEGDHWQIIDFPLTENLSRNFYDYAYDKNPLSPITFTRWNQHNPSLQFAIGSHGVILIDKIELISTGKGKPFPVFQARDVQIIEPIADFETPADMSKIFSATLAEIDLDLDSPPIDRFIPVVSNRTQNGENGEGVWEVNHRFHEEKAFTGIKIPQVTGANAIQLKIYMEHLSTADRTTLPIDFLAYVAPDSGFSDFPFNAFEPKLSWLDGPFSSNVFSYYFGRNNLQNISHAYYHVRRGIPSKQWTTIEIPFADFQCAFGNGDLLNPCLRKRPLSPENIVALLYAVPHYPLATSETNIKIDEISYVKVPGSGVDLQSFWKIPAENIDKIKFVGDPALVFRGGVLKQVIDDGRDKVPPAAIVWINSREPSTPTRSVTVHFSATDSSGIAEYRMSNDSINWSLPEPYVASKEWILSDGNGAKTVYVQFEDTAGNWSQSFHASIDLLE